MRRRHSSAADAVDGIHAVADVVLDAGMTGAEVNVAAIVVVRVGLAAEVYPETALRRRLQRSRP